MSLALPPAAAPPPRWLYLHGFGSGPGSAKGVALSERFAGRGVDLQRLNLRKPSLEGLRFSAMLATVKAALGGASDRAVVFGSSLGGLTACRVAEQDARVAALVLLAPAFRFLDRWRHRFPRELEAWRARGWHEAKDYTTGAMARIDYGFVEELVAMDGVADGWPDVRVPTLIVHGVNDDVVEVDLSRTWAKGKAHVRLVEVNDGHELTASLDVIGNEAESFLAPWLGAR